MKKRGHANKWRETVGNENSSLPEIESKTARELHSCTYKLARAHALHAVYPHSLMQNSSANTNTRAHNNTYIALIIPKVIISY